MNAYDSLIVAGSAIDTAVFLACTELPGVRNEADAVRQIDVALRELHAARERLILTLVERDKARHARLEVSAS